MIRDSHFKAILAGLSATGLDGGVFEKCAQSLLGFAPVEGGHDFGMDGIDHSDPDAPKFLVATLQRDVKGNLLGNLESHKRSDIGIRRVVVATSQPSTGRLIKSLREAAAGEGFQLLDVHGRQAFADMLYRSSHWTSELLGLSGVPSALSAMPLSSRPTNDLPLIGRDADMEWLAASSDDVVVSGHPASGKTHLLRQFVDHGWLFMVNADRPSLANAIRDMDPEVVAVDDAHANLDWLRGLRQLRSQIDAGFRIVAVTWPGDKDQVTDALAVHGDSVLDLQRLSGGEVLEVVKAAGIGGPIEIQREIVKQSAGFPGLTATLCDTALHGDMRALFSGESLLRETKMAVAQVAEDDGMQVLAVMALAGDNGASLVDVQSILGISVAKSRSLLARLGHLGMFRTKSLNDKATIWPKGLRSAMISSYFFSSQPYADIPLEHARPHLDERSMVGALAEAALRGAQVPYETIEPMLLRSGTHDDFGTYAGVGKWQARFALEAKPEWLTAIAPYALMTNPEQTLPRLLERAAESTRSDCQESDSLAQLTNDPPIPIIKKWIQSAPDLDDEQARRRIKLARPAISYMHSGDPQVSLQALCLAMSPKYTKHGRGVSSGYFGRYGLVSRNCLTDIAGLWPDILDAIPTNGIQDYSVLFSMLYDWEDCRRSSVEINVPEDVYQWMRSHAAVMASDIASRFANHIGLLIRIRTLSRDADFGLDIQVPRESETLFPTLEPTSGAIDQLVEEMETQRCTFRERARRLAAELEQNDPHEVLTMLRDIRTSAAEAGMPGARDEDMTEEFAVELARRVSDPHAWAEQAICMGFDQTIVKPLLSAARSADRERALPLIIRVLESETARAAAIWIVLAAKDPSDDEVKAALDAVSKMLKDDLRLLIRPLVVSGNISADTLRLLFSHSSPMVASVAASQSRMKSLSSYASAELIDDWKSAVILSGGEGDICNIIFVADPDLFFDWLVAKIGGRQFAQTIEISRKSIVRDYVYPKLSNEQRLDILSVIQEIDAPKLRSVISLLIGDNDTVFCEFLKMDNMRSVQQKLFGAVSEKKVKAACVAGWDAEEIVHAILFDSGIWSAWDGEESGHWQSKLEYFSKLAKCEDLDISAVGRAGYDLTESLRESARRREDDENVYGR